MLGAMKTHDDKLVRDRIPELLAGRGITYEVRSADRQELPTLLLAKLHEETTEYLAATDDESRIEELADLLEVILGFGSLHGADRARLEQVRARKAVERGTFDDGIVLLSTGKDD
jgi:predicted house-cleaning noncanonical NTP pyrophosphatase (MazG superfamily)